VRLTKAKQLMYYILCKFILFQLTYTNVPPTPTQYLPSLPWQLAQMADFSDTRQVFQFNSIHFVDNKSKDNKVSKYLLCSLFSIA
jgi:hypothetical protein